MADSETPQDTSQQVTSKTPATKQKDPKKFAAGKALRRKNREAREAQKKYLEAQQKELDEAKIKIEELENAQTGSTDPPVESTKMTTTQWLSVISIIVSLVGVCYKREEIKSVFTKKTPVLPRLQPPSPIVPRAPPPSPVDATPKRKVGIRKMD